MVYKKTVAILREICYTCMRCGVWRSLVARTAGGREVAGSNPVAPTKHSKFKSFRVFGDSFFVRISPRYCDTEGFIIVSVYVGIMAYTDKPIKTSK